MKSQLLDEVIACLPSGKTHFRYFKGAYAPKLLALLLPEEANLHQLKQSRFKHLLSHQIMKPVVALCGDGLIKRWQLDAVWREPSHAFLLSVSRWGSQYNRSWYQTSRHGENLVLQLNLSNEHRRRFQKAIDPSGEWGINGRYPGHPVQQVKNNPSFRDTLAWSRIDIDFDNNEALIEEIQSDGVRNVKLWAQRYANCGCKACINRLTFCKQFSVYSKVWSEAMLMATIDFIKQELGIERIFMHTDRSGWQIKKMDEAWRAPKSLYSDLPKKFAFKRTWAAPEFLLQTKSYQQLIRQQPDIDFYQLSTNELKQAGGEQCHAQ